MDFEHEIAHGHEEALGFKHGLRVFGQSFCNSPPVAQIRILEVDQGLRGKRHRRYQIIGGSVQRVPFRPGIRNPALQIRSCNQAEGEIELSGTERQDAFRQRQKRALPVRIGFPYRSGHPGKMVERNLCERHCLAYGCINVRERGKKRPEEILGIKRIIEPLCRERFKGRHRRRPPL